MSVTSTLSLQPWQHGAEDELSLQDVLARVAFERGAFRTITEASLQEEAATEGALDLSENSSSASEEDEEPEQENVKPKTRAAMYAVRAEILQSIQTAENDLLMALDLVSMLETKENPSAGISTMSPVLKNGEIPFGSLGIDVWHRTQVDQELESQNNIVALNTRMESLHENVDDLLGAAKRLEDNVRRETRYWDQVLSISEQGWNICKLPGQGKRLGVRYGFSESAPEFSSRGTAALNSDKDGNILIGRNLWNKPKVLRAILKREGTIIGMSKAPTLATGQQSTLDDRLRQARDSLFDEEIYHEMLRESRLMYSLGVRTTRSSINLSSSLNDSDSATELCFDLAAMEDPQVDSTRDREQDHHAQAILIAARLLLSQGHRDRLHKRTEIPPPLTERQDDRVALPILRPILTYMLHQSALTGLEDYLHGAYKLLTMAGVEVSGQRATPGLPSPAEVVGAESLTRLLMQPWVSDAVLTMVSAEAEGLPINIRLETFVGRSAFGASYTVIKDGKRPVRLNTLKEASEICNRSIASTLISMIAQKAGKGWNLSEKEALLSKEETWDTGRVWLRFNSARQTLTLSSDTKKVKWTTNEDNGGHTLWESAHELFDQL